MRRRPSSPGQRRIDEFFGAYSSGAQKHEGRDKECSARLFDVNAIAVAGFHVDSLSKILYERLACYDLPEGYSLEELKKRGCHTFFSYGRLLCTPCEVRGFDRIDERELRDIIAEMLRRKPGTACNLFSYVASIIARDAAASLGYEVLEESNKHYKEVWIKGNVHGYECILRVKVRYSQLTPGAIALIFDDRVSVKIDGTLRGLAVVKSKNIKENIRAWSDEVLEKIMAKVKDILRGYGFACKDYKIVIGAFTDSNIACLQALIHEPPCLVKLRFKNDEGVTPADVLKHGPYNASEEILAYVIYSKECQELAQDFQRNFKAFINKFKDRTGTLIKCEEVMLDNDEEFADRLKELNLNELKDGEMAFIVTEERDNAIYRISKAYSFKQGFYFKAQVVTKKCINALKSDSKYAVGAALFNATVFRAEGTPWIADVEGVDIASTRLVAGVGFSNVRKGFKGFSEAAVAIIDLYSGKVRVETVHTRRRGPLRIREEEAAYIANKLKKYLEHYEYKEVGIYVSRKLYADEANMLYEKLIEKLDADRIVIASIVESAPRILRRSVGSMSVAFGCIDGHLTLQWFDANQWHPLSALIHYPETLTEEELKKEVKMLNLLRALYYPAMKISLRTPAPVRYASRVARITPFLP